MAKCSHDREKSVCKECGGGSICEHERIRGNCTVCSPEKVFRQYEYKAKQRNFSFRLTPDEFEKLTAAPCVFCGENWDPRGIDRKDNRIGYIYSNCQAACGPCNFMKRAMVQHIFLFQVLKIAKYQELRKKKPAELAQPKTDPKPEPTFSTGVGVQ